MALERFKAAVDYVTGHRKAFGDNSAYIQAVTLTDASGVAVDPTTTAAGENHIGQVGSPVVNIQVVPVVDTNIYASGDVLFTTTAVAGALRTSGGKAVLQSIVILDKDDEKPAMNLVFLRANSSLGTINVAPDIDDTEALDVIGIVPVVAGDYVDLGANSVATIRNVGLTLDATTGTTIYVGAFLTAGTPTFTAATDIKLNFGILQA